MKLYRMVGVQEHANEFLKWRYVPPRPLCTPVAGKPARVWMCRRRRTTARTAPYSCQLVAEYDLAAFQMHPAAQGMALPGVCGG